MRVLVGGGTGFVGGALTQLLRSRGHEVTHVSRHPGPDRISWDDLSRSGLPPCDAAVNLAGENVLNPLRRWDDAFRRVVVASRVETTKTLAKAIAEAERLPRSWVLVTGVGYYRPSPMAEYTEESPGGDFDFFSRLVSAWEAAAKIPGDSTRQAVVWCWGRVEVPSRRCCGRSGWAWGAPWALASSPSHGSTSGTWPVSCATPWRRRVCVGFSTGSPRPRLAPPTPTSPGSWARPWGARPCCPCPAGQCGVSSGLSGPSCCWRASEWRRNAPWRVATALCTLTCPLPCRTSCPERLRGG
ncbi:epimerase family protein SDR39U1 isoform X1 [Malaclemys terrapin pileata]|uniref:epimerase family protein SDR39U1 isoform X1 n=1 Tax=Malaclemys terrapin pileata TaxID=2991368 RepID=UPI0023A8FA2E|nr:epimerase family protein SDR39U1 isoform X1 [Malaclemys terrapin pileata]